MSTHVHSIGPYRLGEKIGSGGMAAVYRATRHGASGFSKVFAVKLLLPEHEHDAELQRLLIAEAKLGAAMAHRNLVAVVDLGVEGGRYYVAMELVDGGDLQTLRGDEPMPVELALHVVDEVAHALAYLHRFAHGDARALGLVHRDITPANVLVSRSGEVKLADLGIVKATTLAEQTRARIVRGKFAYLAPEQLAGEPLGPWTDEFALAITLSELVTGARPFDAATAAETMDCIRAGSPDLAALPHDLLAFVRRCLRPDPAARHGDMLAVLDALRPLRRAHPPAGAPELARWLTARTTERVPPA